LVHSGEACAELSAWRSPLPSPPSSSPAAAASRRDDDAAPRRYAGRPSNCPRQNLLAAPARIRRGVLTLQGIRQVNGRFAPPQIVVEDLPSPQQVSTEIRHPRIRQHRDTIFGLLALTNQDLALLEIQILHAQADPLHQAHPCAGASLCRKADGRASHGPRPSAPAPSALLDGSASPTSAAMARLAPRHRATEARRPTPCGQETTAPIRPGFASPRPPPRRRQDGSGTPPPPSPPSHGESACHGTWMKRLIQSV